MTEFWFLIIFTERVSNYFYLNIYFFRDKDKFLAIYIYIYIFEFDTVNNPKLIV